MDHSHMDHGHMDHGHMDHDMPGMGGSGPKCNMNVRITHPLWIQRLALFPSPSPSPSLK